jgi:hypothetical protein
MIGPFFMQQARCARADAVHPASFLFLEDEIGVGIAIARDPLLGPGRALISASGSYRG